MAENDGTTQSDGTGVDYGRLDGYKRLAQLAGRQTYHLLERLGFRLLEWTIGESVSLIEQIQTREIFGFLLEGLGTKNLVADDLYRIAVELVGASVARNYYDHIAQCTVAMVVNDGVTLGCLPLLSGQHLAVGDEHFFDNGRRNADLARGTKEACLKARCCWPCGETPGLKNMIVNPKTMSPMTALLSGGMIGYVPPGHLMNPATIRPGDVLVGLVSSGVHANALSTCRNIAEALGPSGYTHTVPGDGRCYGEVLLDPTHIYVDAVEDAQNLGANLRYGINVTGHGWRKLMRAPQDLTYRVTALPPELPIFRFIQEHGKFTTEQMYSAFNMGLGFVLVCDPDSLLHVSQALRGKPYKPFVLGKVEEGPRRVIIEPLGITYEASTLGVR